MSRPERRAGLKECLQSRFTSTQIQISAVTTPSQVLHGAVISSRVSRFQFASETVLGRQATTGPVVFVGTNFTHVGR